MGTVKNLTKMFTWCISKFCCLNKFVPNDLKNVNSVKTALVLQESHDNLHDSMKLDINSKLIGQTLILLKDIVQLFWWTLSTDENATVGIQTWMAKYTFKLKEHQPSRFLSFCLAKLWWKSINMYYAFLPFDTDFCCWLVCCNLVLAFLTFCAASIMA